MTGTDRTHDWERIARQTLWQSLTTLGDDAQRTTDELGDAVYWGHDLDPEQVEALRQVAFDLRFAAEEYLARLCEDADPWASEDDERTPSWHPGELPPDSRGETVESIPDASREDGSASEDSAAPDSTTDHEGG